MSALEGWRVVMTRSLSDQALLAEALSNAGAEPISFPTIETVALESASARIAPALRRLGAGSVLCFTSKHAIEPFAAALGRWRRRDVVIAAVGKETARRLKEAGFDVDIVGVESAESLVEKIGSPRGSSTAVYLCGSLARDTLTEGLTHNGWQVLRLVCYETRRASIDAEALERLVGADAITFASPSAVTAFLELAGHERLPPVVASIGPHTSAALRANGIEVTCEAAIQSTSGLVEALCNLGSRP